MARKQIFIVTPKQRYFYYTLDEEVNLCSIKELMSAIPFVYYLFDDIKGDRVSLGTLG